MQTTALFNNYTATCTTPVAIREARAATSEYCRALMNSPDYLAHSCTPGPAAWASDSKERFARCVLRNVAFAFTIPTNTDIKAIAASALLFPLLPRPPSRAPAESNNLGRYRRSHHRHDKLHHLVSGSTKLNSASIMHMFTSAQLLSASLGFEQAQGHDSLKARKTNAP